MASVFSRLPAGRASRVVLRGFLFAVGLGALLYVTLEAFGGKEKLFLYSAHPVHKLMARAMMSGSLRLHRGLLGVGHDEQVYNGAGFTNWSFGVPLVQIPFHAVVPLFRKVIPGHFFPDRLIFFLYLGALVPLLWTTLHRASAAVTPGPPHRLGLWVFAWAGTLVILSFCLYDLMSFRFIVYEETIAYFVVFQLYALCCYVRATHSRHPLRWISALGFAAGIALVVRGTGLAYFGMWGALVVLERRPGMPALSKGGLQRMLVAGASYAITAGPFLAFWLYSNWVKGGSPFTLGYQNGNPGYGFHYSMLRFGSHCTENAEGALAASSTLFESFFIRMPQIPSRLAQCNFILEDRLGSTSPYLPPAVLLLLVGSLACYAVRKERDLALYLPHLTFLALFASYVNAGMGFSYRYAGDFIPFAVLIAVQLFTRLRVPARAGARTALAAAFVFYSGLGFLLTVQPSLHTIDTIDGVRMTAIEEEAQRTDAQPQPAVPAHLECGSPVPPWPWANGKGWSPRCDVEAFSNLYLGVPEKPSSGGGGGGGGRGAHYQLRFKAEGPLPPALRVFVNGRLYTARLEEGEYVADLDLVYRRLYTPVVLVTVEWTKDPTPPKVRLLAMDLV